MATFKPADWPTWELIPSVDLWQAVALSVDVEPEPFSVLERLRGFARNAGDAIGPQRVPLEFARRLRIAEANVGEGGPIVPTTWNASRAFCTVDLRRFGDWAKKAYPSLPDRFPASAGPASPPVPTTTQVAADSLYTAAAILLPIHETDEHKAEELEDLAEVLADELNKRFRDGRRPRWIPVPVGLLPAELLSRKRPEWYEIIPVDSSNLLGACAIRLDQTCSEVLEGMRELLPPNHITFLWMAQAYQAWEAALEHGPESEAAPVVAAAEDWSHGPRVDAAEAQKALQKDKNRDDARHGDTRRAKKDAVSRWLEESGRRPALGKGEFAREFHAHLPPAVAAKVSVETIVRVWLSPGSISAHRAAENIATSRGRQ